MVSKSSLRVLAPVSVLDDKLLDIVSVSTAQMENRFTLEWDFIE